MKIQAKNNNTPKRKYVRKIQPKSSSPGPGRPKNILKMNESKQIDDDMDGKNEEVRGENYDALSGEDVEDSKLNSSLRKRKYLQNKGNCDLRSQQISEGRLFPEEVVWTEGRKIWRNIVKEDFEFILNLLKESALDFGAYLKKHYQIDHQNLPTNLSPLCTSENPIEYRVAPPPPQETLASFVASDSLAMMIASRGSLDEISTSNIDSKMAKEKYGPSPPEEIDKILKICWSNILEYQEKHGSVTQDPLSQISEKFLGKRGRLYNDVWNEEDFLMKYRGYAFKKCLDWSDILRNYHDDHDGSYIEWLLFQLHHRKQNPLQSPPRHRLSSQEFSQGPVIQINYSPNINSALSIIPPPVPVSTQHPASWGPGNRICQPPLLRKSSELTISPTIHQLNTPSECNIKDKLRSRTSLKPSSSCLTNVNGQSSRGKNLTPELDQNHMIDVSRIHPACVSGTILLPPGSKTKFNSSRFVASTNLFVNAQIGESSNEEFECIDEIGLLAECVSKSLPSVCARNFACLSRLLTTIERESELVRLRQTKERLLESCHIIANTMKDSRGASLQQSLFSSPERVNYPEGTPQFALLSMLRNSTRHMSSQYGTSPQISTFPSSTTPPSQSNHPNQRLFLARPVYPKSLGSFPSTQIKHSSFIQSLTIGSRVEARIPNLSALWRASSVTALKYDEAGILRYIETCPISGCQGICQWNAVEDDHIAPPGTHLPSFIFEESSTTTFNESNI